MRRLITIIGIALTVVLVLAVTTILGLPDSACYLCNASRYHAPCLVDLETGALIELSLYDPHAAISGELAEEQPQVDTFSFVRLGDLIGTKQTGARTIEIEIPLEGTIQTPALCETCQKRRPNIYEGRYVLADLYDVEDISLIPITDGEEMIIRCYSISMAMSEDGQHINLVIQGLLE